MVDRLRHAWNGRARGRATELIASARRRHSQPAAPTTSPVGRLTFVATLGGLLFGYDTAVISGAVSAIDVNFIDPRGLSETSQNLLSGFTISSALFGCIVGAVVAGWVAGRFGRKSGLQLAAALYLVSSFGAAFPEVGLAPVGTMGVEALLPFNIYRVIGGVGVGIASMLSPLYIAEIAPKAVRGRLVSYNQLAIVVGIVAVYFVNWFIAEQGDAAWLHEKGWRWMFASEAIPAMLFLLLLLPVPDTPRWLVMQGRYRQARDLLDRLDGPEAARASYREIEQSLLVRRERLFAFGVPVVVVGVMVAVFQQVVGINAVTYYAPTMFRNMGAANNVALLQTILVGAALVIATVVTIQTVDKLGRKALLVAGSAVMSVSMFTLGYLFQTGSPGLGGVAAVLIYIAAFGMSWGPIAWVLLSEMFPNSIKGRALAIAVAANWIANLLVSWSFKVVDGNSFLNQHFHHGFAYYLYGLTSIVSLVFVLRFVPETKGKSLEMIQQSWRASGRPERHDELVPVPQESKTS